MTYLFQSRFCQHFWMLMENDLVTGENVVTQKGSIKLLLWYLSIRMREWDLMDKWKSCTVTVVWFSSVAQSCPTLRPHEGSTPGLPVPTPGVYSNSCPSGRWCHPAISSFVVPFSSCPQSLPESGSFSNKSTLHMRWPKYWSFSLSISPSNEHPGLISFKIDWLDLLAVQGLFHS